MKHVIGFILLLFSFSVNAVTMYDYAGLEGFEGIDYRTLSESCSDPDASLAGISKSSKFLCFGFRVDGKSYAVFFERDDKKLNVLELYLLKPSGPQLVDKNSLLETG